MDDRAVLWPVLLLSLLPGLGNLAGALAAEWWRPSARLLNWALHAASGIVLAIVAVELLPRATNSLHGVTLAAAFGSGGLLYLSVRALVQRRQQARTTGDDRTGMWMVFVAVAIDLVSDGIVLGAGSAVDVGLGLTLAAGQVLADVPEGYAAMANFRQQGMPRSRRVALATVLGLLCTAAATVAFLALRSVSESAQIAGVTVVAGMLTLAAVEDILDEAHASHEDTRGSALALLVGFVLFTLVSAGLDSVVTSVFPRS